MKSPLGMIKLVLPGASGLVLIGMSLLTSCDRHNGKEILAIEGSTMGTTYHIQIVDNHHHAELEKLTRQVDAALESVNNLMSTWRDDSELSRFNQAPIQTWFPLSADTYYVIDLAQAISRQTHGAFDITVGPLVNLWGFGANASDDEVPNETQIQQARAQIGYQNLTLDPDTRKIKKQIPLQLNLSAIAKGFGVDKLSELLDANGYSAYLVEIGGEIRVKGNKPDGSYWKLAIESPIPKARQAYETFTITEHAIATSGDYRNYFQKSGRRFSHIIDPATGRPIAHNLVSVTVISDTTARADAYATALMVMGPERGFQFCEKNKIAAYFIYKQDDKLPHRVTSEFEQYLSSN